MNYALFQYTAIPAVGIPYVPSYKKLKLRLNDSDNDKRCGYDSDDKLGNFIDGVSGEDDYYDDKDNPYLIVGSVGILKRPEKNQMS